MTHEELTALQPGAVIRHRTASEALIVTANYGDLLIAVRTQYVSNPEEWLLIAPGADTRAGSSEN